VVNKKDEEPKFTFGDISVNREDISDKLFEETKLDIKLTQLNLIRKKIPKDGACLFRATSDQLFYSQSLHNKLRQDCVDFMIQHRENYEPFTAISGLPFDDYCVEMRKVNTWGGQVELQALSMSFGVNFVIYSTQTIEPTLVDNGFSRTIQLCYYGNHYDGVYPETKFNTEIFCQAVIFEILNKVLGFERKSFYKYKNIGWECWLQDLRAQERQDEVLAQKMISNHPSPSDLLGFYHKDSNFAELFPRINGNKKNLKQSKSINQMNSQSTNNKDF